MKYGKHMVTKACLLGVLAILLCLMSACAAGVERDDISNSMDYDKGYDYAEDSTVSSESLSSGVPSVSNKGEASSEPETDGGKTEESAYETKIIRNVTQSAQTKDFDAAISGLEALVAAHNGYVENSYVNGTGYSGSKGGRSASYTIRIPAEKLDAFLAGTSELYVLTYSNQSVSNVTTQYYDIVTRLETLRAEQESLQNMLAEAKDINTMLQIKDYLYQVIYEIESYETQLKLLDTRVAYSTINLSINEVVEYTEVEQSWGERLLAAFKQSWISFGKGFQGFTVFFVAAFPTLLVLGAIAAVVILIVVKVNKKHNPNNQKPGNEQ